MFKLFDSRAGFSNALAGDYLNWKVAETPRRPADTPGIRRASTTPRMALTATETATPTATETVHEDDEWWNDNPVTRSVTTPAPARKDSEAGLSEDDIIIITVRITNKERRGSYDDPLPDRPKGRSFLGRIGTRIKTQSDGLKYKAVKLPRGEYLKHFRHDHEGKYVGTEPQREWTEADIEEQYGQYQRLPLNNIGSVRGVTLVGGAGNPGGPAFASAMPQP